MTTKERPILFSGSMVRAILEGRKTQTRQILKFQPHPEAELRSIIPRPNAVGSCAHFAHVDDRGIHSHSLTLYCPYGIPGDWLWVRETWQHNSGTDGGIIYRADYDRASCVYKTDLATGNWAVAVSGWRSSIHMPRWAIQPRGEQPPLVVRCEGYGMKTAEQFEQMDEGSLVGVIGTLSKGATGALPLLRIDRLEYLGKPLAKVEV